MNKFICHQLLKTGGLAAALLLSLPAQATGARSFSFGPGAITPETSYSRERGHGFEGSCTPPKPCFFSVDLPEGNYRVTASLGGTAASDTTLRAELRRLMLEDVRTAPGQSVERSFIVNVRTARIKPASGIAAGAVSLKAPRETVEEAWAWDGRLSLEINGSAPALQKLSITPVKVPTVFLLGDSTVADQSQEPYSSWGQMLPRFFKPTVAVANHAESGETYRDSIARRRLDKVLSQLQPGDTVLLQFGHNDQKQQKLQGQAHGDPQTYQAEIKTHVDAIRARGGLAVLVSPMERRGFDEAGKVKPSLIAYADAARESAAALGIPFIDLNALSKIFYEALGTERSKRAFAEPAPGRIDNTHHNNYGSYVLAQLIAQGLRDAKLPVAAQLIDELGPVDPAKPLPPESFKLAPSPNFTHQRPLGDEDHP